MKYKFEDEKNYGKSFQDNFDFTVYSVKVLFRSLIKTHCEIIFRHHINIQYQRDEGFN